MQVKQEHDIANELGTGKKSRVKANVMNESDDSD